MPLVDKIKIWSFIVVMSLAVILTSEAQERETVSPTLEKGIGQYKHENYDEALVTLKKAREENPKSTLAAFYLGLTYKQLQDYKESVPHLRDAVTFPPKIKGALIELVDCLYQLGELDEAKRWIEEAEREGIRPAQTAFLKGLVLLKAEDAEGAISAFENAKALDKAMTQASNYQIGIAYLKSKKYVDAKRAFEDVVLIDPSSNVANFANQYVDAIARREEALKPLRFTFGAAWQYDDNVVLKPSDTSLAENVADKADSREVYTGSAEYNHRFNDTLGVRAQYLVYYAKQNDLGFYDIVSNSLITQPTISFKSSMLAFPSGYTHTIVNDKNYLSSPSTNAIYNFMVGNSNMGQAFIKYQYKDYLWTPSTPDEDRTGNELGGGLGWYLFYAKNKGFVNVRYTINKDWTEGNNWEYVGNRATVAWLVPVLESLNLTLSGDIFIQGFTNSHTIYNVHRNDKLYTISSFLAYKFYKDSSIQLQYTFVKDDSNVTIYDYNRNIFSAGVEFKF